MFLTLYYSPSFLSSPWVFSFPLLKVTFSLLFSFFFPQSGLQVMNPSRDSRLQRGHTKEQINVQHTRALQHLLSLKLALMSI